MTDTLPTSEGTSVPTDSLLSKTANKSSSNNNGTFNSNSNQHPRLQGVSPECQDICWVPIFIAQFVAIIAFSIYYAIDNFDDLLDSDNDSENHVINDEFWYLGTIAIVCGIVMSILWIYIIRKYTQCLIYFSMYFSLAMLIVFAIVSFIMSDTYGLIPGILALLLAALQAVWIYYVRSRIPFATAVLSMAIDANNEFNSIYFVSVFSVILQVIWCGVWLAGFACVIYLLTKNDDNGNDDNYRANAGLVFLFALSFYWTIQVIANIVHVTAAGVVATWYFFATNNTPNNVVWNSFTRSVTYSFGSICFGSFLVAVIQALRAMLRYFRDSENSCIRCCVDCMLACCEEILEYFNMYAFSTVAIYGVSYWTACKQTWEMFENKGFSAIINDDLTGTVLSFSCLISGLLTAVITGGTAYFPADQSMDVSFAWAGVGFLIAFVITLCAVVVVRAGVATIFVCFADDPRALQQSKPEVYDRIARAWEARWGRRPDERGVGQV